MHKLILLVLVFMLLFVGALNAQEATPEVIPDTGVVSIDVGGTDVPVVVVERAAVDPTVYTVALIVVGIVFLLGFGIFGAAVRPALVQLGQSVPSYLLTGTEATLEDALDSAEDFAGSTGYTQLDDVAVKEIRQRLDDLFKEIHALRDGASTG